MAKRNASVLTTKKDQTRQGESSDLLVVSKTQSPPAVADQHNECKNISTLVLQRTERLPHSHHQNLSSFLSGPGLLATAADEEQLASSASSSSNNNTAICRFYETSTSQHFPHALQQFYRCWSWWRSHPEKQAVLLGPSHHRGFRAVEREDIFTELVDTLLRARTISSTTNHSRPLLKRQTYDSRLAADDPQLIGNNRTTTQHQHQLLVQSNFERGDKFAMATPRHAVDLRKATLGMTKRQSIEAGNDKEARDWETGCPIQNDSSGSSSKALPLPRISILNRDASTSRRSLLNAEQLAATLAQALHHGSSPAASFDSNARIPIVYFENKTFEEQVEFWDNNDIVLSPHGAQLSGIPFLPSCGSVLEIFPLGLYLPFYFGSLAAEAAGVAYTAVYTSVTGDWKAENAEHQRDIGTRQQTRRRNVCPSVDVVVEETFRLIESWRVCCQKHHPRMRPS